MPYELLVSIGTGLFLLPVDEDDAASGFTSLTFVFTSLTFAFTSLTFAFALAFAFAFDFAIFFEEEESSLSDEDELQADADAAASSTGESPLATSVSLDIRFSQSSGISSGLSSSISASGFSAKCNAFSMSVRVGLFFMSLSLQNGSWFDTFDLSLTVQTFPAFKKKQPSKTTFKPSNLQTHPLENVVMNN